MHRGLRALQLLVCAAGLALPELAEAARRRPQVPDILISAPAQGSFTTGSSIAVSGQIKGVNLANHTLYLNGVAAAHDGAGFFSETVFLDPAEIFQPIVAELRRDTDQLLRKRAQRTVHLGDSVADGGASLESVALRLDDRGLDKMEPRITSLVDLDLATLLPPGTLIIDDYEYFCVPLIGCLTTDVVVNPTGGSGAPPPNISGYTIAVDAMAAGVGFVESVITLNDLFVSARATELGCDINVTAATSTIDGDYDLWFDPVTPTQIDVTQLGGVGVGFGSFGHTTDCGGGFGAGLLELLVDLLIGDVETLVRDAFVGFLGTVPPGGDDPPIAAAIEDALAGVEISGPIGQSLGVSLDTPIFDIPIDDAGMTIGSDATIVANVGAGPGQCNAPAEAPDLAASWHVGEPFPPFGSTTPVGAQPYDLGLCISTSAFNQLLKAETECGLLVTDIRELFGIPLTTSLFTLFFPQLANVWPTPLPARVELRPELAPVLSGESGPQGELADLHIGHLGLELIVEDGPTDTLVFSSVVGAEVGLDLVFDDILNALSFQLGALTSQDVSVVLIDNPFGLDEPSVVGLLTQLLPLALPAVASSLGSFPIPEFFGLELHGVETSRNGQFMSLFTDLVPANTLIDHDYTGVDFQAADLTLVGDAFWATDNDPLFLPFPDRLRLTNNGTNLNGSAWYDTYRIEPAQSWSTTYRFQLSYQAGDGADGIGFHLQGDGPSANPDHEGGGLSSPHLSVAIDTWNNGPEGTDESLKVIVNGSQVYFNDLLDFGGDPNPGSSTTVFRMELAYDAATQTLRVALFDEGGSDFLDETIAVDLTAFGPSHAGFSARTGGFAENHDVRSWRLSGAVPIQDLFPGNTQVEQDFTGADFQTGSVSLVGDAFWATDNAPLFLPFPDRLRLTNNGANLNGAAWYNGHTIDPSQSWSTKYRFQLSHLVGDGADGLGFHVHGDGLAANPDHEGNGLSSPHLTVAIDTWNNGTEGTDESLKVILNGSQVFFNDLLDFGGDPNPGSSSSVFRMELSYLAPTKELRIHLFDEGGSDYLNNTVSVDLSGFGPSHIGFSARTGGFAENHDIRTWSHSAALP